MDKTKNLFISSSILRLEDFLFVPTSFLRLAHKVRQKEDFGVIEKYKDTLLGRLSEKIMPYPQALIFEGARLYGYYKLIEYLTH